MIKPILNVGYYISKNNTFTFTSQENICWFSEITKPLDLYHYTTFLYIAWHSYLLADPLPPPKKKLQFSKQFFPYV